MSKSHKIVLKIKADPAGPLYGDLLGAAVEFAETAILVVRSDYSLRLNGKTAVDRLKPFLIEQKAGNKWPGTELRGGTATIMTLRMSNELRIVLFDLARSVYGWCQPDLPEDLAFFSKGQEWFFSITHERESYFYVTPEQRRCIFGNFPRLLTLL